MAKGVPTARSQRYKATQHKAAPIPLKETINTIPSTSGNDVFPSLPLNPVTQAEGAQRAFATVTVLLQSLLLAASPGTHPHNLLQVILPYFHDCSEWYRESDARNTALQQQLDELNSKLLAQDSEILSLQNQLKTSQAAQEFYNQQALKADMVSPIRRSRLVSPPDELALSPDQLYQQWLLARDDIQIRDRALARLQFKHNQLDHLFEEVLSSSSETLALHVTLLEQHIGQHARQQSCASALSSCQAKFLAAEIQSRQTNADLLELRAQYDKLVAQVSRDDPLVTSLLARASHYSCAYSDSNMEALIEKLLATRPHLRPQSRPHY